MNPIWLLKNVRTSWRYRGNLSSFLKRLLWAYSNSVLGHWCPREMDIRFRYEEPLGKIQLRVRANGGSDGFIHGEVFEHQYYRLGLPFRPATILDLGANAGFTAIYFSRVYPSAKIIAVEPIAGNVRLLRWNLDGNAPGIGIVEAAVASQDGPLTMELNPMDYGHKVTTYPENKSAKRVQVPGISIPTLRKNAGWDRIGLLKIDIEGYEKELFAGNCDWLQSVDAICIECHEGFGEEELKQIALHHGFAAPKPLPGVWLLLRKLTL